MIFLDIEQNNALRAALKLQTYNPKQMEINVAEKINAAHH